MATGFLSHIDFSVGEPKKSIPFYDTLLTTLGYMRWRSDGQEWQDPDPTRAAWGILYPDGSSFGIDLRPALEDRRNRRYDRYEPGPHHIAIIASDVSTVDQVYHAMLGIDAKILDPPTEYGGKSGYGDHYYAVFVEDPDGVKLEVCCVPRVGT